jgi:hypothetical protein
MPSTTSFDPAFHIGRLSRAELAALGREYMLFGHLLTRAGLAQVHLTIGPEEREQIAILEWMGASPVYTSRLRQALGITGDDIAAIFKCLQLDVGFAHQYMDVAYQIDDERNGQFWLNSCGALLDVEPTGEEFVFSMCHHIEDPTFDATAVATNPRARIRPIHRPPRNPAGREPHCHWTTKIDPALDPVTEIPLTDIVRGSRLAALAVPPLDADDTAAGGRPDYAGDFEPAFQLEDLSAPALVDAVTEFCVQNHLLVRSMLLALTERHGPDLARDINAAMLVGAGWVASERLRKWRGVTGGTAADVMAVLQVHPALGPRGYADVRLAATADDRGRIALRDAAALHEGDDCSWYALLANGGDAGLAAVVHGVNRRARVERTEPDHGEVAAWDVVVDVDAAEAPEPDAVAITKMGTASSYEFSVRRPIELTARR